MVNHTMKICEPKDHLVKNPVVDFHAGTSVTARIPPEKVKNICATLRKVLRAASEAQVNYSGISCVHRDSKSHRANVIG